MFHASRYWLVGLMVLALAVGAWGGEGKTGAADTAKATPPVGELDTTDGSYRLTLDQLPAAVKEAFLKQAGGNPMKAFSMEMKQGKFRYDCDVFIEGKKYAVIADENGKLLSQPIGTKAAEAKAKPVKDKAARKGGTAEAGAKPDKASKKTENVNKADLADQGASDYFVLQPGYRLTFQCGIDTLIITVLDDTKTVDGVKTRVVEERETENGKLSEISRNYFAIDRKAGDVYYFGETVDEYDPETGKVISHDGAWEAGVDGATFGLALPGKPKVGDKYYQEMAPQVAMDHAKVVSVSETVTVPAGTFENCLKTEETTPLESGDVSVKIYAPGIGLIKDDEFELAKVEKAAKPEAGATEKKAATPEKAGKGKKAGKAGQQKAAAPSKEKRASVAVADLPANIKKSIDEALPKAEIVSVTQEGAGGPNPGQYDVVLRSGGKEYDMEVSSEGKVIETKPKGKKAAKPEAGAKEE